MKSILKIISILVIIMLIIPISLPIVSNAYEIEAQEVDGEEGTLTVSVKRDEINREQINIIATDTTYNIEEIKYVHKRIEKEDISYFEEDNEDVYELAISPSKNIETSFMMDGYGTYTVYVKNSYGNRYLSRITIHDPEDLPDLTLIKDEEEPLSFTIQAISENSTISEIKIAKVEDINQDIDFSIEGTNIDFVKSNNVNIKYTVSEEGLYKVYVEDENGGKVTKQIFLSKEGNTPIEVSISDLGNRKVSLNATDSICDITKIKVAKASQISDFDDFETNGEEISFTKGKEVNVEYTAPEDGTYKFLIEDELGYRKMTEKRIIEGKNAIDVIISQDEENSNIVNISVTDTVCNIVEVKVAIGQDIDMDYFKSNGESLEITPGKEVHTSYEMSESGLLNVYVKDEEGYSHLSRKTILIESEPEINTPPKISLLQNSENPRQIDVVVSDIDSFIDKIKWAKGSHDKEYFKENGTTIGQGSLGKIINTEFIIDEIGVYTVYAEDDEGECTVEEINVLSLDEAPAEDTEPPKIEGVEDGHIYNDTVKPIVTDENLESIVLTRNDEVVENYQNDTYIEGEGIFVLTAKDKAGNQTSISFIIDCTIPEIDIVTENVDDKNVEVTLNLKDNLSGIDVLKIASGEQNISYFDNNVGQINIIKDGLNAVGKINVTENGKYTAYVKDLAGNEKIEVFEITGIKDDKPDPEPEPDPDIDTTPPTISFEKEVSQDEKSVNLTINVEDLSSQIKIVKMESGKKDIDYFENNGTKLNIKEEDKKATAVVNITKNGDYTVYAEDEEGNKIVQIIKITEIKEDPDPEPEPTEDTTPPVITGVEDGKIYRNYVTPKISDENLKTVILIKNGKTVEDYENGNQIKENGEYTLIATDEAGNETRVSFTIDIKEDEDTNSTNTNNNQSSNNNSIGNNTSDNNIGNTNTSEDNGTGNTNSINNNTNNANSTNINNNSNSNSNTNNYQSNGSISSGNGNNKVNTNNRNTQNSNIATSRLPYAGFRNVILCFIIGIGLVSVFCYIKYRKYRKM